MSAFSISEKNIQILKEEAPRFTNNYQDVKKKTSENINNTNNNLHNEILKINQHFQYLSNLYQETQNTLNRANQRAKETDPDKIIYGPSMIKRIKEATNQFSSINSTFISSDFSSWFQDQIQRKFKQDQLQQQQNEQKQKAEELARVSQIQKEEEDFIRAKNDKEKARLETIAKQKKIDESFKQAALDKKQKLIEAKKEELRAQKRAEIERKGKLDAERQAKLNKKKVFTKKDKSSNAASVEANLPLDTHIQTFKTNSKSSSDYLTALQMVLTFITRIMTEPHNESHRSINISNPIIKSKIVEIQGGKDILTEIGFKVTPSSTDALQMQVSPEQWNVLVKGKSSLETAIKKQQQQVSTNQSSQQAIQSSSVTVEDEDEAMDEELQAALALSLEQNNDNNTSNNSNNATKK